MMTLGSKIFAAGSVTAAVIAPPVNFVSQAFGGIPLTALFMACAGALCSIAWAQGEISRGRLIATTTASTFVAAACVSVIPEALGREWPHSTQSPLALLFGLGIPWVVPALKGAIPTFFRALSEMIVRIMQDKISLGANQPRPYDDQLPKGDS
jgi:hypothetical protein